MLMTIEMPESRQVECVYLNGRKVKLCVAFDTDEGWVEVYELDTKGNLIIDHERRRVQTKKLFGTVRFLKRLKT